jgi:hypothetical protein
MACPPNALKDEVSSVEEATYPSDGDKWSATTWCAVDTACTPESRRQARHFTSPGTGSPAEMGDWSASDSDSWSDLLFRQICSMPIHCLTWPLCDNVPSA